MDKGTSTPALDQAGSITLTSDIVAAYVSNNSVRPADLPTLLADVHAAVTSLTGASASAEPTTEKLTAAQIRRSITPDALVSFLDGKPYKTLKRHLSTHGMTFDAYRARFGLPPDYPTTAASYSALRSAMALKLGLGQQRRNAAAKAAEVVETIAEAPKTRGRKRAAEPKAEPAAKPTRTRKPK